MTGLVTDLTGETFDSEIESTAIPHLVDFWADWCTPCHVMHPILEELARDYEGKVRISKIDVHDYQEISDRFEIASLPTLIFFSEGKPVKRLSGVKRRPQLEREFAELLGESAQ